MQIELTEVDSSTDQRKIVLDSLPVMIGQGPDAGVRLDDQWVSRHHCEISVTKDTLVVRDLGSMLPLVGGLLHDSAQLDAMSQASRRLARPEAARNIAGLILDLLADGDS